MKKFNFSNQVKVSKNTMLTLNNSRDQIVTSNNKQASLFTKLIDLKNWHVFSPRFLLIIVIALFAYSCSENHLSITSYVDPFIGTDAHGHVFPGATLPFGMVQLSPDTRKDDWDGCSGYHYSDSTIMGFSHTHLSGTGVGDYGDIRFMPTVGKVILNPTKDENNESGYQSKFSHKTETASPGYYQVLLNDYNINVELTTTQRAGFHKYTFPKTENANIIIDLFEGVTSDQILDLWIRFVSDTEIEGLRRTKGWADNQWVFFNAEFSKPFAGYGISVDNKIDEGLQYAQGKNIKAWVNFQTEDEEIVLIKVGISAVNTEGAKLNRMQEIPSWDFEQTKTMASQKWEMELSKIKAESNDKNLKKIFYTSLYHSMIAPNIFTDTDGAYRGHDMKIHISQDREIYTVFSLWDTFRALHPLLTITHQQLTSDLINTMLLHHKQGGLLPVWELAANETNCMIGYHAVPVIVDAYMKNIRNFDVNLALQACVKSATQSHYGLDSYKTKGYIPSDAEPESVSKTLEYAYDDWCIAVMAKEMGDTETYDDFIMRAQYYKNIYDPETGFMRAKNNETRFTPFDPAEVNFNYTEANSWQYSFFVPQDISGLMELMGGKENFVQRLDQMFTESSVTTGRHQADITGLIGQYAHGNEPSHHMAYLYSYAGKAWKTQEILRKIMDNLYTHHPDGLCGNEDCGQMSAWYVFSAMGFYPVTPGSPFYTIGTPMMDKITISLENGNTFVILAKGLSKENKYIQKATLNGKIWPNSYISHQQIMNGGLLIFEMGNKPNKSWGTSEEQIPITHITDKLITPVPFIKSGNSVFFDTQTIELACADPLAEIKYKIMNDENNTFIQYTNPITIESTTIIKAKAKRNDQIDSFIIEAKFVKIEPGRTITIKYPFAPQYSAGGNIALIDHQHGGNDFRTGRWQGYEGVNLEAVVDLGKTMRISTLSTGFFQDVNAWIFMPEFVEYSISDDGKKFRFIGNVKNPISEDDWNIQSHDFTLKFAPISTRYIKIIGKNRGYCPDWHKGAGNNAWIFADEIVIK
ncbi:MAG: GH92 family glycosyl hydrolase [Bacteroidales bacterium]|jgi:predicted alpha-1,2-mannosidase|nr:GH92 family glycosyl hydrolase [Bacteroidales bacterium]MDI9591635.1 GH92 family glycosyl hydrolase [Bacteroidota bacterium]OQC38573.1 MAG: Glycosyl hydrolase family 92 [Bacteroidetes bacterium ADurb.Bin041]HNV49529.1 GH92 family glycosyl hydrolase [Bacteroidales bacterium]HNY60299.1 GH92 family glycosyl hydrolase [Bacteroidales bacterium]